MIGVRRRGSAGTKPAAEALSIFRLTLFFLFILGFGLRLFQLDGQSLWWDEGISLNLARSTLPEIWLDRINNVHPPLYFIILKFWSGLTGLNTFSGRYLSVLASFLQIAGVYAVSRRWYRVKGAKTNEFQPWHWGVLAATMLIILSPLSVIYGQEIRVYAFLPLIYLALLALTWSIAGKLRAGAPVKLSDFLWLALLSWVGLHLHYVVIFVFLFISAWLVWVLWRCRRHPEFKKYLASQLLLLLASLPWYLSLAQNWPAVQAEANAGTYLSEPVPLDFLLQQVWSFHHTGLAGALSRTWIWPLSAIVLGLTILLLLLRVGRQSTRLTAVRLLGQWLIPLSGALLVWGVRSFSHPRYISFAAVGIIILAGYLLYPGWLKEAKIIRIVNLILPALLFGALLLLYLTGLYFYFVDPQFEKDDMRAAAAYLATSTGAKDLIIVPDTDWSFPLTYEGEAVVVMPGLQMDDGNWAAWKRWSRDPGRVFTLTYRQAGRDWQGRVPYLLEAYGSRVGEVRFEDIVIRSYQLQQTVLPPTFNSQSASFGPLHLLGVAVGDEVTANTAVAVALQWQLDEPATRLQLKLRLLNPAGFLITEIDHLLVDPEGRPTELWPANQSVTTYHLLPLPPGTVSMPHTLEAAVFAQTAAGVDTVEIMPAVDLSRSGLYPLGTVLVGESSRGQSTGYKEPNPIQILPDPIVMANGLELLGLNVERDSLAPGEPLFVHLQWRVPVNGLVDIPQVILKQKDKAIAQAEEQSLREYLPPESWRAGALMTGHYRLNIPAQAGGEADLELQVGPETVPLTKIQIEEQTRQLIRPEVGTMTDAQFGQIARLIGFDLSTGPYTADEPLTVTLTWQSLTGSADTSYTVFTHLLAEDGTIISQHDAPPVNGDRPTSGWILDEFIVDSHIIQIDSDIAPGIGRIAVGLYDPATGRRLPMPAGQDTFILPVEIVLSDN